MTPDTTEPPNPKMRDPYLAFAAVLLGTFYWIFYSQFIVNGIVLGLFCLPLAIIALWRLPARTRLRICIAMAVLALVGALVAPFLDPAGVRSTPGPPPSFWWLVTAAGVGGAAVRRRREQPRGADAKNPLEAQPNF